MYISYFLVSISFALGPVFQWNMDIIQYSWTHYNVCSLTQAVRAREAILTKLEQCLQRCPEDLAPAPGSFSSVLHLLLQAGVEEGARPSRRELLEAALELLFAGHETTASAACSTMLQLAKKVRQCFRRFLYDGSQTFSHSHDITIDILIWATDL